MSAKILDGFKVVNRDLGSAMVLSEFPCHVQYKIGAWVRRNGNNGPLAVFHSIENARRFVSNNSGIGACHLRIFRCKYKESKVDHLKAIIPEGKDLSWSLKDDRTYYDSPINIRTLGRDNFLPVGTRLATQVILLEEEK